MSSPARQIAGSFRDPSGFLFQQDGTLYRQINDSYAADWQLLQASGLLQALHTRGWLVSHEAAPPELAQGESALAIIQPRRLPFISYPYEWSFAQLKDAALLTLDIQRLALKHGMTLKDASAYNVQWDDHRPIFIDTLSFTACQEGEPWVAYRQFCQHFLAPLALMARTDCRCAQMLRIHLDGIPLDFASRLMPRSSWLNPRLAPHLHLHAWFQNRYAGSGDKTDKGRRMPRHALAGLLDSLRTLIHSLKWKPGNTEWDDYYTETNYSANARAHKERIIADLLQRLKPGTVWDLGANRGDFSRLASQQGAFTVAFDIDPSCVHRNWRQIRDQQETRLLPLIQDLANPSPSLGWHHQERFSLLERGPADVVMALALIHHLAISNNVPLTKLASFFADCGPELIIEFVPKQDSQVQRLLASRNDIFPDYTAAGFETAFQACFTIQEKVEIDDSERTLYHLKRHA